MYPDRFSALAEQRIAELRREAEHARLARSVRDVHPERPRRARRPLRWPWRQQIARPAH